MAQSLRWPLFRAVRLSPSRSALPTRRCFSQIYPLRAAQKATAATQPQSRDTAQRSLQVMSSQMTRLPSDLGLLEGTFVSPTLANLKSLLKSPRDLLRFQYKRFNAAIRNSSSLLFLKVASPRDGSFFKRVIKIRRAKTGPTAVALHREMYASFAEGDDFTLKKICCTGLYETFKARIGARSRGEKVVWELVKYNKRAKVVSNRAARFPIDGAAVIQAVVRISSRQKLTRWIRGADGKMEIAAGSGKERDVVEYVVVQRRFINWTEEPWQVWGTTKETTMKDLEEWKQNELDQ